MAVSVHPMPRMNQPVTLLLALLLMGASSCVDPGDHLLDEVGAADEPTDRVRFCLSLARAINAVQSAAPATAQDGIEEAVTQAPDDLLDEVRNLAESIRVARDLGSDALRDPDLQAAAEQLHERTRDLCDPTI